MSETLVLRLRRAHEFILALWVGDIPPAKDSACELCAEAANELERLTVEVERLRQESDRFRVALMHYAERNYWGYSEPLSPDKIENWFVPSMATGKPGWLVAEEALKHE
jgi:hypothetical protein